MENILIGVINRGNDIYICLEFTGDNCCFDVEISLKKAKEMLSHLELAINSAERIEKDNNELIRLREKFKD